jgi:hypothetical protein
MYIISPDEWSKVVMGTASSNDILKYFMTGVAEIKNVYR